jgi:hypothetical protein
MSNWFEKHPATTIITHTLIVAAAVWGTFFFVFEENKVALYKAQVENEKATASQYKSKVEVLEVEIARLRDENQKYLGWMVNTPNTIPHLEQRIKALSDENAKTKHVLQGQAKAESSATGTLQAVPYSYTKVLNIGESFVDPRTNATFGIGRISQDFAANAVLGLPGQTTKDIPNAKPGNLWTFAKEDKNYQLTLTKVDWFSNKAEI